MHVNKTNNPISRVKCVVNTCEYYVSGDHCAAEMIEVQPRNAADTQQTDCATFSPAKSFCLFKLIKEDTFNCRIRQLYDRIIRC